MKFQKRIDNRWTLLVIFLFFTGGSNLSAQSKVDQKALFVGNSYTYFWNLPQQVNALAKSQDFSFSAVQSTAGGATLGHHWRGDRGLKTVQLLEENHYDIVVLQDHSRRAVDQPDSLMYFMKLLNDKAKQQNTQVYLYMTWSREWDPFMIDEITKEYYKVAEAIGAKVVPVGLAWQRAKSLRPELKLYDEDGSHPSALGAYLSACVFYATLSGKSAEGLPNRLISKDFQGEKLYLNIQSSETALFCQKVADEIVKAQVPR